MTTTSHVTDSSSQSKPVGIRLPLIPLSPLTQTSIEYAKALAQTTKSISETTTTGSSSNIISLLNKDLHKERENLDRLTKDIENIQSKPLTNFNNYEIAKEIAYINCSLFRLVVLNKSWISNFDKQSNIVPLLDFHRYLSHSFAHQIIYSAAEEETSIAKKRKSMTSTNNTNTIAQSIQIAYILLHVYRDFSGCTAILTSLQMPEVQRLEKLWSQCSIKMVSTYKELVKILSHDNNYEAYHHQLWLHTTRFLNTTPLKSQTVAIPFMHAHLTLIRNLIHTHSAVMNSNKQNIVLSDAGKKSFLSAIHVLEFCQQHTKIDPTELDRPMTLASASRRLSTASNKRSSSATAGFKLSVSTCFELDKLHTSPSMYHWIVSRAYLTRAQLHQESLQVEPLAIGEIELEAEEEYDLYWDFFSQPPLQNMNDTQRKKPSSPTSILKEIAKIDTLLCRPEDEEATASQPIPDNQAVVNDLMIVTPDQHKQIDEVAQVTEVMSSSLNLTAEDVAQNIATNEDHKYNLVEAKDSPQSNVEDNTLAVDQDTSVKTTLKEEAEQGKQENKQKDGEASNLVDVIEFNNEASIEENVKSNVVEDTPVKAIKPILSPAAPEFIPQQQNEYNSSSEEDDDDIIIITEEMSNTTEADKQDEEDDDEEEEWTGYPLDNTSSSFIDETGAQNDEEDEEEEWTGYPVNSQDEDEDDDEVWKGYPVPQQQNQQTSYSSKNIELPSPPHADQQHHPNGNNSNSHFSNEEWKGYGRSGNEEHNNDNSNTPLVNKDYPIAWDNNKNQLHAIGKAAARKLQYSISTTDNNRKRLPTIFTPSAST